MAKNHVSKKALQKTFHLKGNARGGGKGCATKCYADKSFTKAHHGNYRLNGYKEIEGNPPKFAHYVPDGARLAQFPLTRELQHGLRKKTWRKPSDPQARDGWKFGGTSKGKKNYQNANVPFPHQYHHMCSWEGISSGALTTEELKLLQKAEYNLNDGFNLIVLPMRERVAMILQMYTHPNNHKAYNTELKEMIRTVKAAMSGGDPDVHLDEKTAVVMKDTLENWEKPEFEQIMKGGKKRYPAHVDAHPPSSPLKAYRKATA